MHAQFICSAAFIDQMPTFVNTVELMSVPLSPNLTLMTLPVGGPGGGSVYIFESY
jgi:hypothetical protein